jgi:hypothetical protein
MSTKKEADKSTTRVAAADDDNTTTIEANTITTTTSTAASYPGIASLSEQRHSLNRALDEAKDNIKRTIDEARREIPRNTEAINDYQEQTIQATREIADSYLESQRQIIKSFQSTWAPHIENTYQAFWNSWISPRRGAEIYARAVSNIADNIIATTRLANNAMSANMEIFKTFIQREKDDVKELSKIGVNTARIFEQTSKEVTRQQQQQQQHDSSNIT